MFIFQVITYLGYACLIIDKIHDNQERSRHGRVSQCVSICKEKARPLGPTIWETSLVGEGLSSQVHGSPTLSFRIHVSAAFVETHPSLEVFVALDVPKGFPRGPSNLSLLLMYLNHTARHIWDGEVV